MTDVAHDWEGLRATWHNVVIPRGDRIGGADDLRLRVARATRRQWIGLGCEIVLTILFLGYALSALAESDPVGRRVALTTALFTLVVWTFALWNRRGAWRPLGENTSEFLRLSRARAAASRRSILFVHSTLALSVIIYAPVFVTRLARGLVGGTEWWRWSFFAAYLVAFLSWTAWERRRVRRDEEILDRIARELAE